MLNPQWLRSFTALVEHGSFTRAAEHLDMTQAGVSQHVGRLEQELGVLVLRRPRAIELTPAGRALLDYCRELGTAEARLRHCLSSADEQLGEISLITPGSIGLALYPRLLALQERYPGLTVRHRFAPTQEILDAILSNSFELGLVTIRPDDPRLAVEKFGEERLELIAPAGAPAERWEDLQRLGFVDHPDGEAMATRLFRVRFPGNPGLHSLRRRGFTNQIALILEPISRGLGFTVLPRHAREAFGQPERIKVVAGRREVCDTLWLVHRAEWPLSKRAQLVLNGLAAIRT